MLEPDPNSEIYRSTARWPRRRPDIVGAGMVFSPTTITGTAVLEYGPTEILPPVGAISKHRARLCRPGRQASRAHPRGKPGFWTFESGCGRETDSLCWREMDSNSRSLREGKGCGQPLSKHCRFGPEPAGGSAFRAAVPDWQRPEEAFRRSGTDGSIPASLQRRATVPALGLRWSRGFVFANAFQHTDVGDSEWRLLSRCLEAVGAASLLSGWNNHPLGILLANSRARQGPRRDRATAPYGPRSSAVTARRWAQKATQQR